jgi:hypothetical protein
VYRGGLLERHSAHPDPHSLVNDGRRHCRLSDGSLHLPGAFIDRRHQLTTIIGENGRRFLGARNPHIEGFLIDQIGCLSVGMDDDMIGGAALGGKSKRASTIKPSSGSWAGLLLHYFRLRAVGHFEWPVNRRAAAHHGVIDKHWEF